MSVPVDWSRTIYRATIDRKTDLPGKRLSRTNQTIWNRYFILQKTQQKKDSPRSRRHVTSFGFLSAVRYSREKINETNVILCEFLLPKSINCRYDLLTATYVRRHRRKLNVRAKQLSIVAWGLTYRRSRRARFFQFYIRHNERGLFFVCSPRLMSVITPLSTSPTCVG